MDLPPAPTPPSSNTMTSDRTANLLNLLKFSGSSAGANSQQHQQHSQQHSQQPQRAKDESQNQPQPSHQQQASLSQSQFPPRLHQPAPGAADPSGLLAALMRGAHDAEDSKPNQPVPAAQPANTFGNGSPPADTRSFLLNLLNRPKPSQTESPHSEPGHSKNQSPQSTERTSDNARHFDQEKRESLPYASQQTDSYHTSYHQSTNAVYPQSTSKEQEPDISALYQLMGALTQSSPQTSNVNQAAEAPQLNILKKDSGVPSVQRSHHNGSERSPASSSLDHPRHSMNRTASHHSHQSGQSHHAATSMASPAADIGNMHSTSKGKEPVAAAMNDAADQADREARNAVDRAEREQNLHDHVLESPRRDADTTSRLLKEHFGNDLTGKHEWDLKDGSSHEKVSTEKIDTLHVVADDVNDVADSWESADQDEIVVIEEAEASPVKVYNFPMKPWITISLQEDAMENRPQFRDEAIMDIARLKKEFDQIDRNLYTASQTYMTYGMSKHGGLRVIRQDDGKDAKAFTDTKDRIFNVSMSVTPSDHDGPHKEAIIGTGISGTVYWVEIKDGEKDHIEESHLEQYGFALPPLNTLDGDVPGGALKTRARASTMHPEYYAMGRGKCIHFIWPSYVLQNNLLKPGHDRVADTEALLKQCSLKINTGKAGKDFTFSQDDSVVVSLDKSGRVKFWDIRELTAVKEGSSPRAPLPAHSSFEVKEPLLTLASTPEGEKAWPTSVLLLDKLRPYQKRCALRYMIVGMKQNHTLQLWDLALGKPVQEFNLPHSKESDAVCSVMYHPGSGMIIVGHPTRNSIYFAHLSAPKYNLKSVSQAEYIQRLVAQDSSIPQPDSTAVISGMREYSFANRGILRSLDILSHPAMVQDVDEPTLFELYAMHSKGVACILIKQHELGWSKDNKVLNAVDAVTEGLVTVSKLKTPQQAENASIEIKTLNRGTSKESLLQTTPAQGDVIQRGPESVTPVKLKNESKEVETPVQSSKENQSDKPERKSRKKKVKEPEAVGNGPSAPSRDTPVGKPENGTLGAGSNITPEMFESAIASMETRLTSGVYDTLKSSLRNLHGKIDEGARVRDESFNHHQLKLLDMVSEVLNENTQKVLESLIHRKFTETVIPAISEKASKGVTELLNNKLQPSVVSVIQKEIQNAVPQALNRSLRSGDLVNSIADRVGPAVANSVQQELATALTQRLTPILSNAASQSAQHASAEIHQQYHEQFEHMKAQHRADASKIDQLLAHVTRLTDTLAGVAASQNALQTEFMKFKQQQVHELPGIASQSGNMGGAAVSAIGSQSYHSNVGHASNVASQQHPGFAPSQAPSHPAYLGSSQYSGIQHARSPRGSGVASEHVGPSNNVSAVAGAYASQMSRNESEAENDLVQRIRLIEQAIQEGRLQEAILQWVQSGRESEIFRRCLSRFPPSKFDNLPPLILLVIIATISKDVKANPRLKEEIEWIEMAVRAFGETMPNHDWEQQSFKDVMRSASQTMQLLINRLNPLLTSIQDGFPTDPFLSKLDRGKLEWIIRSSSHILESFSVQQRYDYKN